MNIKLNGQKNYFFKKKLKKMGHEMVYEMLYVLYYVMAL